MKKKFLGKIIFYCVWAGCNDDDSLKVQKCGFILSSLVYFIFIFLAMLSRFDWKCARSAIINTDIAEVTNRFFSLKNCFQLPFLTSINLVFYLVCDVNPVGKVVVKIYYISWKQILVSCTSTVTKKPQIFSNPHFQS